LKVNAGTYEQKNRTEPCLVKLDGSHYWNDKQEEKLWIIGGDKEEKYCQLLY